MALLKQLEAGARQCMVVPRVWARYGTAYPSRVRLPGCAHWICINPLDARARKEFVFDAVRGRVSPPLRFWRAFIAQFQPDFAVDVGVNFGECLWGTTYPPVTRVLGVEANPEILPYLESSLTEHPNRAQISLMQCLVADQSSQTAPFYVNSAWSGSSTAIPTLNSTMTHKEYHVPSRTLDSLRPAELPPHFTLVFKMDIEGYEQRALRGFQETCAAAGSVVGFIEFDEQHITAAGESPAEYTDWLLARFHVFAVQRRPHEVRLRRLTCYADLPQPRKPGRPLHCDLILTTPATALADRLPASWTVEPQGH